MLISRKKDGRSEDSKQDVIYVQTLTNLEESVVSTKLKNNNNKKQKKHCTKLKSRPQRATTVTKVNQIKSAA